MRGKDPDRQPATSTRPSNAANTRPGPGNADYDSRTGQRLPLRYFRHHQGLAHADVPPITVGKLVLNRNPENYFAEVEQAAFSPATLVPGIAPSPDKMLQGRLFSYHDTHIHRLGANYHLIPCEPTQKLPRAKLPTRRVHAHGLQRRRRPELLAEQLSTAPNPRQALCQARTNRPLSSKARADATPTRSATSILNSRANLYGVVMTDQDKNAI